ncbi:MAG: galactosyltransferase-related protein [Ilumatobacteraceae bacterium]
MTVSVLIPYTATDQARADAFHYVERWYRERFDDVVVGSCVGPWSKGEALRDAAARAAGEILIVADADSLVELDDLEEAIRQAAAGHWVVPHRTVYRLTEAETARVYDGARFRRGPGLVVRQPYTGPPGGGIVVLQRAHWELVGGVDPRFMGWGGEDISFGYALETLVGWHYRLAGRLFHLWHEHPAPDLRGSAESEALVARYKAARGDRERMAALVDEHRYDSGS